MSYISLHIPWADPNTIGIYTLRYYITERIVPPSTRSVAPLT